MSCLSRIFPLPNIKPIRTLKVSPTWSRKGMPVPVPEAVNQLSQKLEDGYVHKETLRVR